ncbi:hypothetical protein [Treponema sp. OMZ 906]|nr:hypothetical protein [Treponema sp. OMZ 906]UTC54816.1 hypothetical protein E4N69_08585 [Treponema sp. OMZ 906]
MVDYIETPTMGDILSEGLFSTAKMAWLKINVEFAYHKHRRLYARYRA